MRPDSAEERDYPHPPPRAFQPTVRENVRDAFVVSAVAGAALGGLIGMCAGFAAPGLLGASPLEGILIFLGSIFLGAVAFGTGIGVLFVGLVLLVVLLDRLFGRASDMDIGGTD